MRSKAAETAALVHRRAAQPCRVLARSGEATAEALGQLRGWIGPAGLTLHPDKTRLVDMTASRAYFDFLGYRFQRTAKTAKGKVIRLVWPKSMKKLRESLGEPTRRANGRSLEAIIEILNPKLREWFAYFKQAHTNEHRKMDRWVRMRLRSILRKRHKGQGRGRGLDHFKWPNRSGGRGKVPTEASGCGPDPTELPAW